MNHRTAAAAALFFLSVMCCPLDAADHDDVIDLASRHQTIENFGASDAWTMKGLGTWSQENKNKIADLLFSIDRGIGLSLWRFNIGGGTNTESIRNAERSPETFEIAQGKYDWTKQEGEQWFARAARDRGVPFLLGFVNSPPGRMTRSGLTNSNRDDTSTTNLKPGFEGQYATYLCDILEHFHNESDENRRLNFNYVSPVNEPQLPWGRGSQEGNRASNDDIKRILLALHKEIILRHLSTRIRAPESNAVPDLWRANARISSHYHAPFGNYLQEFLGDPTFAGLMDQTICYHDYSSADGPSVEKDHRKLGQVIQGYPGAKLWMSEICIMSRGRDLGMQMALHVAKLIHADLALSGASAWHWWLAVSDVNYKDGLIYTDWHKPGDPESIITSKSLWVMGNFSRFIRPGMIRIDLRGEDQALDGLSGSAYLDPQTHRLVLVYINLTNQLQSLKWTFKGGSIPSEFTPFTTSETEDLTPGPVVSANSEIKINPQSVVTFSGTYK